MPTPSRAATTGNARHVGVLIRSRGVLGSVAAAVLLMGATPASAKDDTILGNFLSALMPNANAARPEPPPAQPGAETKSTPRRSDARPLVILPRATSRVAVARPPRAEAGRETALPADPTIKTGTTAQAAPAAQAQPQAPAASPAPAAAAPPPKPAVKPRNDTAAKPKPPAQPNTAAADPAADSEAAQFCRNIADAASDARFSWQVRVLEDLDKQVKESVTRLESKRAEYEDWLKRREDFLRKVEDGVVEMYGRMRPDAAALQIASMTEEVALSVLMKLKPRTSSAILGEMEPTRAARLTDSLAGVRLTTREQGKTP